MSARPPDACAFKLSWTLSSLFSRADPESEHPGIHTVNEDSQGLGKLRGGMNVEHCLVSDSYCRVFIIVCCFFMSKRTIGNNKS